jgi:hypothetical protein
MHLDWREEHGHASPQQWEGRVLFPSEPGHVGLVARRV